MKGIQNKRKCSHGKFISQFVSVYVTSAPEYEQPDFAKQHLPQIPFPH